MVEMNMRVFQDPFLRHVRDINVPLGLTPHDAARMQPGPGFARTFELIADNEQREYPKSSDLILAGGAAVGIDENGICSHFWAGQGKKFVGFLTGSNENRAVVKTRGSIVLKLDSATQIDRGMPVYCTGPNSFSLKRSQGACEVGIVRYVQGNGRAAVAFRRHDSDKPLPVDLKNI